MSSDGSLTFDGYYGMYTYHLTSEDGKACTGSLELGPSDDDAKAPKGEWGARGSMAPAQLIEVKCDWEGHVHVPVRAREPTTRAHHTVHTSHVHSPSARGAHPTPLRRGRALQVWTTPAVLAFIFVLCLWTCYRQRASLSKKPKRLGHTRLATSA